MLIPVLYEDQKLGMVYPSRLDKLIACKKILAFRRSNGWVFVEEDTIRKDYHSGEYSGPERRVEESYLKQFETVLEGHEIIYECNGD